MAETLAVLSAITFAFFHSLEAISILLDSQTLINTINKKERKLEIYGALNDIYLLSLFFKSISFSFIPKSANVRTDQIAKQVFWALNPI